MRTDRPLAVLGIALLLVVAGCSGGGGSAPLGGSNDAAATEAGSRGAASTQAEAKDQTGSADTGSAIAARVANRKLVRTAEVTIEVERFEAAKANLTATARAAGGYVGRVEQHSEEVGNESYTRGTVVLRVPAGNFSGFMAAVESEGPIVSRQVQTKDVTEQYVDLQARLKNLQRERDRLRELYEQANDTEAVLKVEARLSEVQGRIEQIQGQLRALRNRVAYATVTVHLREPRPEPDRPAPDHWYDVGVVAAFLASIEGVLTVGRALVVAFAYALPYVLAFGLPVLGVVSVYRYVDRQI